MHFGITKGTLRFEQFQTTANNSKQNRCQVQQQFQTILNNS